MYNQHFIKFVRIEIFYRNCDKFFSFKSKLYKHLREKCVKNFFAQKFNLLATKLFINFKKSKFHFAEDFFAQKFNFFVTKLLINFKESKSHFIKNFFIQKSNLFATKLFINFKKSKSHFIIVEILRIMKFIIFIFDQDFEFDFRN